MRVVAVLVNFLCLRVIGVKLHDLRRVVIHVNNRVKQCHFVTPYAAALGIALNAMM